MKKGLKKLLSLFLAVLMVTSTFAAMPFEVFAGTVDCILFEYSTPGYKYLNNTLTLKKNGKYTCTKKPSMYENEDNLCLYGDEIYLKKSGTYSISGNYIYFTQKFVFPANGCTYKVKFRGKIHKDKNGNITKIDSFNFGSPLDPFSGDPMDPSSHIHYGKVSHRTYFKNYIETSNDAKKSGHYVTIGTTSAKNDAGNVISVPKGTKVTSVDGINAYYTYNGKKYYFSLNYCTYIGPTITKPVAPSVSLATAQDIYTGAPMTINWNSVFDAHYYTAAMYNSSGQCVKSYDNIYGTSATFMTETPGTYSFKVTGKNNVYTGDTGTCSKTVTVHADSTVTFKDEDGNVLNEQKLFYGGNATAPSAPAKRGYTFKNWSGSLMGIKADTEVTAQYDINKYKVQFIDYNGNIIGDTQEVTYGENATAPQVTEAKKNYEFVGWSSEDYLNVYKVDKSEPIKVYAVYAWKNKNLPVECTITSASRQTDGYYINFDVENYPDAVTRGRAVICLKTSEGKLVDMTESTAFSIPKGATKSLEVFVPCERAATVAEIIIVDSYASGVPISEMDSISNIESAKMWSDWATSLPDDLDLNDAEIESRQEWRFRNARTTTSTTASSIDGWTRTGKTASVGSWTGWSTNPVSAVNNDLLLREVNTKNETNYSYKTQYNYSRYKGTSGGKTRFGPCAGTWSGIYCGTYQEWGWHDYSLSCYGSENSNQAGFFYKYNNTNDPWYNQNSRSVVASSWTTKYYQYRDTKYTYSFMRWDDADWSKWAPTEVTANDKRQVETRTTYRYKSTSAGIENNDGVRRNYSGNIDSSFAGKQLTMYIYRFDGASDYTNEYIGQTVVGEDGSYSFDYILREEPTVNTGDFTIAIGIEGSTDMQVVGKIEAPKPTYIVKYYDIYDNVISEQQVEEGDSAVAPTENLEIKGKTFICWNNTCTNVRADMDVKPVYIDKIYTIVYVDFRTQQVKTKEYKYGDSLILDTIKDCESGNAVGWDVLINKIIDANTPSLFSADEVNEAVEAEDEGICVESDMVVSAVYDTKTYNVNFYDYDGNIVDSQVVEYGGAAEIPELPVDEGVEYYEWNIDLDELMEIKEDIAVVPEYEFTETAEIPTASVETGAYNSAQTVALTSSDENALIYYTLDGSEPTESENALLYSEPIVISDTAVLKYYATSFNKNDSDVVERCYVIGNNGKLVTVYDSVEGTDETFIVNSLGNINTDDYSNIEGYTFDNFYTDDTYTTVASMNDNDWGAAVYLYAKYNINSYTVNFCNASGDVIKTETVEYGNDAIPPIIPDEDEEGNVFFEWSGGDYTYVTEDVTLTAVYKAPSEIVNIEFDKTAYTTEEGTEFRINPTVSEAGEGLQLIWVSSDEKVATVADDGTVTAVGTGEATIYAVTEDNSASAECVVTVGYSPNYSICIKDLSVLGLDSKGFIRNIPNDGTNTVGYVSSQLRNGASSLQFKNISNRALSTDDLVGTGTVISLVNNGRVIDSKTAVLTGDITGDGVINNRDVAYSARVLIKKQTAEEYQLVAMDANGDGKVNNRDVAMLSRYLVGKEAL